MTSRQAANHGKPAPGSVTKLCSQRPRAAMQSSIDPPATTAEQHSLTSGVQQSISMPNTPSQRPQVTKDAPRSPSLGRTTQNSSPRSLHSDTSHTPPAIRKRHVACKYETAMAKARRRVPYSLGPEKLIPEPSKTKMTIKLEQDEILTHDMQKLYEALLPSPESESRRKRIVEKLEKILRDRWPGFEIKVDVFGSTGNQLGTSKSDVDICINTNCKEMNKVCSIAELLASHGMERVVCVSSAKVPIVKLWDPELQMACDMNVNNPIALENTRLVSTYVAIDPRVRPLAMIVKHWAKRRILNDAALGGTLSSYTWICLVLNFLQTRDPPILPSLQSKANDEPQILDGVNVAFERNLEVHKDFGQANQTSLGELLFQFFQYYGYEFDFETSCVSVRSGKLIPKSEKGWHLLQDNRLCVEEPFNTSRNLANTADDTSMRGIHLELRRAFGLVSGGYLDRCCEQFVHPPDEVKQTEHFVPPSSRPVITQPPTQSGRSSKSGNRGGRNGGQGNRNVSGRRASNPGGRQAVYLRNLPFQMTTQEMQLQAQHQQHLLHDQLFQQYQYLQLQEQELRLQLHQQNLRQRGLLPSRNYPHTVYGSHGQDENKDSTVGGGFSGTARPPLSAPMFQQRFPGSSPFLTAAVPATGVLTNPSSPRLASVIPDTRRFPRRSSVTLSASSTPLRAHSQPARPIANPMVFAPGPTVADLNELNARRSSTSSTSQDVSAGYFSHGYSTPAGWYDLHRRPAEYVGYYVGQSPSLLGYPTSASISPIPSQIGLAIQNGGLSPRLASSSPASVRAEQAMMLSESLPPNGASGSQPRSTLSNREPSSRMRKGPLIVNGSLHTTSQRRARKSSQFENEDQTTLSTSTSEDLAFDTPSSSDEQSQDAVDDTVGIVGISRGPEEESLLKQQNRAAAPVLNGHQKDERHGKSSAPTTGTSQGMSESQKPLPLAWSLGRQLSAVEEVRTPSPGQEKQKRLSNLSPNSGSTLLPSTVKTIPRIESDMSPQSAPLLPRPNGTTAHPIPVTETSPQPIHGSSWQTQKKKRNRKTVKSENDAVNVNPTGGDLLPLDVSQRKGG